MSFRLMLLAGVALTALSGVARADDRCGQSICHDDQAAETRRLNEMQLENPGAVADAVPNADDECDSADNDDDADDDVNGQGGPYYPVEPDDGDDDRAGPPGDAPDTHADDDDAYPDEDAPSDGYDDDVPYTDEDDD